RGTVFPAFVLFQQPVVDLRLTRALVDLLPRGETDLGLHAAQSEPRAVGFSGRQVDIDVVGIKESLGDPPSAVGIALASGQPKQQKRESQRAVRMGISHRALSADCSCQAKGWGHMGLLRAHGFFFKSASSRARASPAARGCGGGCSPTVKNSQKFPAALSRTGSTLGSRQALA